MPINLAGGGALYLDTDGGGTSPSDLAIQGVRIRPASVSNGDGTVTTGGSAQTLFSGAVPANGYMIQNTSAHDMWINDEGTAAVGSGIYLASKSAPFITPPGYKPPGVVSLLGTTTSDTFVARRW